MNTRSPKPPNAAWHALPWLGWRARGAQWGAYGLALAALVMLLAIDVRRDQLRWDELEREQLASDVSVVNALLLEKLRAMDNAIESVRTGRFWQASATMTGAQVGERLGALVGAMDGVHGIVIIDRQGTGVASNRPELVGVDYADRECFRALSARPDPDAVCVSRPLVAALGLYTVVVTRMVAGPAGEFGGTVSCVLEPAWFARILQPLQQRSPDLRLSVVRSDGGVIRTEPASGPWSGGDVPVPELWAQRLRDARAAGAFTGFDGDGRERLVAFAPLDGTGAKPLATVASRDLRAVRAPARKAAYEHAAAVLVVAAIGALALVLCQQRRRTVEESEARIEAERREHDERLREADRDLKLAVEGAGVGIWRWDPETGELRASPRVRDILGVPGEDVLTAKRALGLVHADDREQVVALLQQALSTQAPARHEHRVVWPDGTVHWVALVASGFPSGDGARARLHGMVRDITALKSLQLRNEEAQANLAELVEQQVAVQTASAFAHDLNQPLLAISAYSEAALNALPPDEPGHAKLRRMLEGSFQQAQRAGALMHDLSAHLSQALHVPSNPETFDLNQLIRECVADTLPQRLGAAAPDLRLDAALPLVAGSRVRSGRVIRQLLANASEAHGARNADTPNPGVTVSTCRDGAEAVVAVADEGGGVPPEDAERIFSPFFSTKAPGLGLGLSISRALAESQGGRLTLAAREGAGAEFHFTIPLANHHADDLSH